VRAWVLRLKKTGCVSKLIDVMQLAQSMVVFSVFLIKLGQIGPPIKANQPITPYLYVGTTSKYKQLLILFSGKAD
jgi:hypothetical protein